MIFDIDLGNHFGLMDTHSVSMCSGIFISTNFAGIFSFTKIDIPPEDLSTSFLIEWKFT